MANINEESLSVRSKRALSKYGTDFVLECVECDDFSRIKNIGRKDIEQLKQLFAPVEASLEDYYNSLDI